MNIVKKNIRHILFFVAGIALISCAFKLYSFGVDYETKTIHSVILMDTASTLTKVKQNTFYNTIGYFIEVSTDKKFHSPIQDKLYREFEAGGNKPISMEKTLSKSEINHSGRGFLAFIFSFIFLIFGSVFILCVAYSKLSNTNKKFNIY